MLEPDRGRVVEETVLVTDGKVLKANLLHWPEVIRYWAEVIQSAGDYIDQLEARVRDLEEAGLRLVNELSDYVLDEARLRGIGNTNAACICRRRDELGAALGKGAQDG